MKGLRFTFDCPRGTFFDPIYNICDFQERVPDCDHEGRRLGSAREPLGSSGQSEWKTETLHFVLFCLFVVAVCLLLFVVVAVVVLLLLLLLLLIVFCVCFTVVVVVVVSLFLFCLGFL